MKEYILELENTILCMAQTALDIEVPTGENTEAVEFLVKRTSNPSVLADAKEFLVEIEESGY
jgi:hypothetical protein